MYIRYQHIFPHSLKQNLFYIIYIVHTDKSILICYWVLYCLNIDLLLSCINLSIQDHLS